MILLLRFAFRNLSRNTKRTCLAALAMSMGLAISFWLDCAIRGRNAEVVKFVTSSFTGSLQIYNKEFLEEKSISKTTDFDFKQLEQKFGNEIDISPRVYLPSLISSGENSYPVIVQGVISTKERNVSSLFKNLDKESILNDESSCSPGEILISQKQSKMLNVGIGEKIVLLTQTADGNLGNDLFRIKGLYDTGSANFDKGLVFITANCAKELGSITDPHEIIISLKDGVEENIIFEKIKPFVSAENTLTTWENSVPAVARMIKVNNAIMKMVSIIVLVVVILGFVNTLLMSVFERTKEIGMMLSIGFTPNQVRLLLVFESLIIAICSTLIAAIIGSAFVYYHSKFGFDLRHFVGDVKFDANDFSFSMVLYPVFSIVSFLKVIALSILIAVLSVLFPAYKASRLSPLEVLRS